jgi:hypothetical protein
MQNTGKRTPIASTLKSEDTEEPIDLYFYRPLGYRWALLFERLGVSPNTVTIASIFLGAAAGVCFYFTDIYVNLLGMFLLVWANTYDSADGQLARMTGQKSALGRILDGFSGDVWFISIYASICFRLMPEWGLWIWGLAAVTGYCHTKQAALADYYRLVHLHFLQGKAGSELSNTTTLKEEYRRLTWRRDWFFKLANIFYTNYTNGQERLTPQLQKLLSVVGEPSDEFRQAFRRKSLPLMKYANILSFNTRAIVLCLAVGINIPWLYFVFEFTVLNIMLIYMRCKHEKFCRTFAADITRQQL